MSFKETLPVEAISIGSVATVYSSPVVLNRHSKVSFQLDYTNGAGTGMIQYSNNGTNWIDITATSLTLSGTSSAMWEVIDTSAGSARIKFSSGGTMTGSMYKVLSQ